MGTGGNRAAGFRNGRPNRAHLRLPALPVDSHRWIHCGPRIGCLRTRTIFAAETARGDDAFLELTEPHRPVSRCRGVYLIKASDEPECGSAASKTCGAIRRSYALRVTSALIPMA